MGVGYVITSCQREDNLIIEGTDVPIKMAAYSEWPVIAKALETEPYTKDIVVWAEWTAQNPAQTVSNVFGLNGTKVYCENGAWSYSPTRFWYPAHYEFAAAAPASLFTSSHKKDGDNNNGIARGSFTRNTLELLFDGGFNLKEQQQELLVAFTQQENSNGAIVEEGQSVEINLQHQLVKLNIKAKTDETDKTYTITNFELSGIHSVATRVDFRQNTDGTIGAEWKFGDQTGAYLTKQGSFNTEIVNDLLVFPESTDVTIKITFNETYAAGGSATITKSLTFDADWDPGRVYTYELNIKSNSIIIGEPTVTAWQDGESIGDITM